MKRFFKKLVAGLIGADILVVIGIMVFALIKLVYVIIQKDLFISKYLISTVFALLIIVGFMYGIRCYKKKNINNKLFKLTWVNFWMTIMMSLVFSLAAYLILKEGFNNALGTWSFGLLLIILAFLLYPFAALLSTYFVQKKSKKIFKRGFLAIILNPVFMLIYFWLFVIVVYHSMYVPCGVSVLGVDNNANTINTQNLDITSGERILKIDNTEIMSLNDVKRYINSLDSTKEVAVETNSSIYYVKTYMQGNNRYMGLLLSQAYCERIY